MSKRQVQAVGLLVLAGAFPLSAGIVLHRWWLLWSGVGIVGAAFVLALFGLLEVAWFWTRAPRPPVTYVECDDRAEPGASPKGGPAEPSGSSGVGAGPPSVSVRR